MVKFNSLCLSFSLIFLLACSSVVMAMEQKTTDGVHASSSDGSLRAQYLACIHKVIVENALPEVTGVVQQNESTLALITFKNGVRIAYAPGLCRMLVIGKDNKTKCEFPLQNLPAKITHPDLLQALFPEVKSDIILFDQNLVSLTNGTAVMFQPDGLAQVIDTQGKAAWQFAVDSSSIAELFPKSQK